MLFSVCAYSQELLIKKINSEFEKIVIDLGRVDHVELYNSDSGSEIVVKSEGLNDSVSYQLTESNGHVLLQDIQFLDEESAFDKDKACSELPYFPSYKIFIPENRVVYLSLMEGNLYAEGFKGELNVKVEDGILKLQDMKDAVKVQLNTGSIFVQQIKNTRIDAETNRGILVSNISQRVIESPMKQMQQNVGEPKNEMWIRAILANIYLYESQD